MDYKTCGIAKMIDHSILKPEAGLSDLEKGCKTAMKYKTAFVCVKPCDVPYTKEFLSGSRVGVAAVVGFPHGSSPVEVKVYETESLIRSGADEIDAVVNFGRLLSGGEGYVADEIRTLTDVTHKHGKIIKVIFETCYLNDELIEKLCRMCNAAGVDFVKTSTGFGSRGASVEDIITMRKYCDPAIQIKASGGIRTLGDMLTMIRLGVKRIGTSSTEDIMKEAVKSGI